jgi:hypothetical protein
MASVTPNEWGLVFIFENDEVDKVVSATDLLAGSGGLVTAALTAAGVSAPAALITAAISAYFKAYGWLVRQVNQGCGVYLTVPWPAVFTGNITLIVPTTRPTEICAAQAWSQRPAGEFRTEDSADLIGYTIEHGAVAADTVTFRLQLGANSSGWRKIVNMPDGQGSSWDIAVDGRGNIAENSLWANQVTNGQVLTFRKAKWLGLIMDVLRLGSLEHLQPGDRVTFQWMRD